jgi:hypothetical protein
LRTTAKIWAAYTLLGVGLLYPLASRLSSHILADDAFIEPGRSDAYNFLWTYWWIQKSALAGHNFYHCNWVFPPTGANLYFHTHVILPTLLTLPFGLLLGPVGGYNSMIILMLSGCACVYYSFLRRTFRLRQVSSFVTGGLFGFSPYFVFKTHAHVNLIGGAFWGSCLAVLCHAYVNDQFGWRRGLLFSLGLWATFWTSFVEFFALLVVCVVVVVAFEMHRTFHARDLRRRDQLAFFAMVLPGGASLTSLVNAPNSKPVDIAPFANIHLADLLIPPRLSLFGGSFTVSEYEYWGSHLPIVFVLLSIIGLVVLRQQYAVRRYLSPILVVAITTAVVTLNPAEIPITLIRHLPMGTGFRVAGRFLPFFYFFLLVLAAHGLDRVLRLRSRWALGAASLFIALLTWAEMYPSKLSPSPVKAFALPADVAADGALGAFTLVIPRGNAYTSLLDTYQVSMNVPVVHLSYLAREDLQTTGTRSTRFPALYPYPKKLSARVLAQMKEAGVPYVLFEDQQQYYSSKFRGEAVAEQWRYPGSLPFAVCQRTHKSKMNDAAFADADAVGHGEFATTVPVR